jgi:hypothetical protein
MAAMPSGCKRVGHLYFKKDNWYQLELQNLKKMGFQRQYHSIMDLIRLSQKAGEMSKIF